MSNELMFPKKKRKKRMKRHPPSIVRGCKGTCLLCTRLNNDYREKNTEEHHVFFGSGRRKISEENGFVCDLCIEHHRTGPDAVHNNKETREYLCRIFQEQFEKSHTHEEFMKLIGKNYL